MICCIVAAFFILRYVVRWNTIMTFLGISEEKKDPYGWNEAGDLDRFRN